MRQLPRNHASRPVPRSAVVFHASRISKLDLAKYWKAVAAVALPHYVGRPLTLVHCPHGVSEAGSARPESNGCRFLRHEHWDHALTVERVPVLTKSEGWREYLTVKTVQEIVSLLDAGVVELHTLNWTKDSGDRPDRIIFDLDAGPQVKWVDILEAAALVRGVLRSIGLESWPKTTGGAGLHVVAPIQPAYSTSVILEFSKSVAAIIAGRNPALYTILLPKENRQDKILIDYLRNKRTDTSVGAYSPRARPGAPVSLPITWAEVTPSLDPSSFTVTTVPALAKKSAKAWAGYFASKQTLDPEAIGAVRSSALRGRR